MELKGQVAVIGDTQTFASGFTKRELVIETDEKVPQKIKIEFLKERGNLLDGFRVGDQVTVEINIQGREYKGQYYVSVTGWKIDKSSGSGKQTTKTPEDYANEVVGDGEDETIPF